MTEADMLATMRRVARELMPALTDRLGRYGLGELEVRRGELRVRVARDRIAPAPAVRPLPGGEPDVAAVGLSSAVPANEQVTSPAVGLFVYAEGLGPGLAVTRGASLGFVEMLGVRHGVRATRDGVVRHLVTESGEAVEYGQVLVEIE